MSERLRLAQGQSLSDVFKNGSVRLAFRGNCHIVLCKYPTGVCSATYGDIVVRSHAPSGGAYVIEQHTRPEDLPAIYERVEGVQMLFHNEIPVKVNNNADTG
jgi:hypothetical protein